MREHEMRMRVFRFLSARMRNMIMPATVGIGLAVGAACTRTETTPVYSAPVLEDAAGATQDAPTWRDGRSGDLAPSADVARETAGPDLPEPGRDVPTGREVLADSAPDATVLGDGPSPSDSPASDDVQASDGVATEAGLRRDTMPDFGGAKYIAPFFDAGPMDSGSDVGSVANVDTPGEVGSITTKYLAQMPDAGVDGTPALRYMAQMPDAAPESRVFALYMASMPNGV